MSFGLNAGVITASASGGGGAGSLNISAGTTSSNVSAVTFSNANGVTFGFDGSNVTATVQTNYAGTGFTSTTTAGTAIVGTLNSNGVSLGVPAYLTTSPAVTNSSWTVSDSATSATVGRLAFVNSNGVTFGLSTSNNGQQSISASYSVPTVTNSSWTVSDSSTSATVGRLAFVNSNGVSFSLSTSNNGQQTIKASIATTYAGTGFTSTTTAGTAIVGTLNTSGLSLGVPVFLTTSPAATSWTVSDSATSATVGRLAFVNGNGVSFALSTSNNGNQSVSASVATTYAGTGFTSTTTAGTAIVATLNTSGLSMGVPAFLTTAALSSQTLAFSLGGNSGTTNSSQILNGGYILAGGANITINQSNNSISIVGAAAGTGGGIVGLSNSQTVFTSGTVALSEGGGAITIASSAGGQSFMFSVPQTSSIVGTNGISISTNGSTISVSFLGVTVSDSATSATIGRLAFSNSNNVTFGLSTSNNGQQTITASVNAPASVSWLEPFPMTNTALFGPVAGSWYLAPFVAPGYIAGGRINLLHQNTSTAGLFQDITGGSYVSSSTGNLAQSYTYSKAVALWSQGSGSNSTRLESIWSNSFSFGWSKSIGVALSQASNINITVQHSISYISEIGSNGAYTLNQYANSTASSVANSSTSSGNFATVFSSGRNMLSNSIIEPIGFNTTISGGAYWLGFAWSTTRATASTGGNLASALDFSVSSEVGISRLLLEASYRNWASTATTARSHIMPYGVYTGAANMAPPQFIALSSDLSSLGSAWVPYFNFQVQGITK